MNTTTRINGTRLLVNLQSHSQSLSGNEALVVKLFSLFCKNNHYPILTTDKGAEKAEERNFSCPNDGKVNSRKVLNMLKLENVKK